MAFLHDYNEFAGRHWETGSVRNVLAYQGVLDPATRRPLSEALLLGISGGAAFGYFVFDYADTDPFVALLPRNTFDPLDTLLERLAIPQERYHTPDPTKAERNLMEVLESGLPAIVWADVLSLPYNALTPDDRMWSMDPIVVAGYEDGRAQIADRAAVPLEVSAEQLAQARGRVKKVKHRVLALGTPNLEKLPSAIDQGIRQCIALYTEAPPKGARHNFGLAAYELWAQMLTNTRNKQSWQRMLSPGRRMYAGLAGFGYQPGAFGWARTFPANQVDDKLLYAEFLQQAARLLDRPQLADAAERFRAASSAWRELSERMLPDDVPLFGEARRLLLSRRELFTSRGGAALGEIRAISVRLAEIAAEAAERFPLTDQQAAEFRQKLAEQVGVVAEIEREAIERMQAAMR